MFALKKNADQTPKEEFWNALTHGFGAVISLVGFYWLAAKFKMTSLYYPSMIFGTALILMFSVSTSYHLVVSINLKSKLRVLDHICIYYLIAASYTPICMSYLQGSNGYLLLIMVWSIAAIGTLLKLYFTGKYETLSVLLYGIMGWLILIDIPYLINHLPSICLTLLSLGGLFYSIGIIFYVNKLWKYSHVIWHIFVLLGATSHWFMNYFLI